MYNSGGAALNVINLPQHIIDMEKMHRDIQFGEVGPFRYRKANGRVVKLVTLLKNSVRFRNNDDALLYVVDMLKTLPADKEGKLTLVVEHKQSRISKIENITEEEVDYPMDAARSEA